MKAIINILVRLMCLPLLLFCLNAFAQIDPGKDFDLQGYIDRELAKRKKLIQIPPGRYRLQPKGNRHLLLRDLNDVTIVANAVELICTETVQAINVVNCKNLTIVGLAVDYDPLPFTQGKIVAISADKTKLTVDILKGYSTKLRNDKLEIYDPETGELVTRTYYSVTYEVDEANRRVVFTKKTQANVNYSFEDVGDIVVFDSYNTRHAPHAVVMDNCEGLTLENVQVYAGPTFSFFERNCNGSRYNGCKVDRRPIETDLVDRDVRRMRSNNADGFHSKSAQIGPSYRNCIVRYNGDDGFAINGNYHVISETNGNLITVIGKGGIKPNILPGDPVELVSYDGTRLPDAIVRSIKAGRVLNAEEKRFLCTQNFLAESGRTKDAANVYMVEIDRSVDLPLGSVIASANRLGNGFEVVDCIAGPNRSRGILVKASNGTIANNSCIGNWGMAIKCSPEHQWLEAGSGKDLTITNNTIENCNDVGIAVYAIGGNGRIASPDAHTNIIISGNTVSGSLNPAFVVTSTTGLFFMNNRVESPTITILDPARKQFGRAEYPSRVFYLENVKDVKENFGFNIPNR
jgi:hypothetical protein